ncbi:MAG: type 4a pilus biogenesis protein PilO [Candidatus Margulisbacteria bacterium]|jgi:Tfp pilus assembly protein PilO|nr:type 4a pilus biogenesis protein PilO [Candidatus Margulisiibacteriota bacterium]
MLKEKIIKISTLGLILLLGFMLYRVFIIPKREGIKNLKRSLKNIEFQMNRFLGEEVAQRGGSMEKDQLEQELAKLVSRIPSERDLPRIIDQILIQAGKGLKIEYTRIEPKESKREGSYLNLPIEIEFLCSYQDLFTYLTQLKALPEVTVTNALDLRRLPDQPDRLAVRLLLSAFVVPEEEEERATAINQELPAGTPSLNPFKPRYAPAATSSAPLPVKVASTDTTSRPAEVMTLEGIVKGEFSAALINGQVIYVGDKYNGYELINIRQNSAILRKGGRTITLQQKD